MRRPALALLLGCLLLVAGASALDGYDYYQTIEYAGCDQEIYQQDIVIHRTTGTAYNETAGGLEIWHIFVGEHCREDYRDIRFTNSTGAELAYYLWPDYSSESARFTVRLEGADQNGALVIWYGNQTATTTSDGTSTYLFFDDCEGSDPSEKWDIVGGSGTLSYVTTPHTGLKSLRASGAATYFVAGPSMSSAIFECYAKDVRNGFFGFLGSSSAITSYLIRLDSSTGVTQLYRISSGTFTLVDTAPNYNTANWHHIRAVADHAAGKLRVYVDGSLIFDHTYDTSYVGHIAGRTSTNGALDIYLDQTIVRAYSATPPAAITFSGEQETAAPPVTAFTASPTAGLAPLTVQFTDTSTGSPTSWAWTFGDGGTSAAQNPQHTYTAPGLYTVTLNATNEYGSDYELKTGYITVYSPITAQFTANVTGGTAPVAVQFTDLSTGGPTAWSWSFGDGNTSAAQNPVHTYTTAGTHTVTLTASHPYDSDTETKTAYITVAVLQPFPGLPLIPRDLIGNGLYTDINGNNRLDYNDLTVFFQHLAWAKTAQPTSCFDFNGNGWLDYNDVITLFTTISGGA